MKFKLIIITILLALRSLFFHPLMAQQFVIKINKTIDINSIKKSHPRVMVGDFEPIKANLQTDTVMQRWMAELGTETTMDALALRYNLTGDTAIARQAYETALKYDLEDNIKKGPHHYGKSITFLGCTYDWLYGYMSVEQRGNLLKKLKRGLEAYLKDPDKTNFHNMNHCLNAGAMVAAIAVANEEPALAKQVLDVALKSINLTWYEPDGVTPEGPHYMNWSSLIMISGLSSLDVAFGDSFGLSDDPGLMGYGDFMMHITVPGKGISVKYSDCYTNGNYYNLGQVFWIANKFNRPDLAQYALENDVFTASGENPDYSGKIHQLLWYNPQKFKSNVSYYKALPLDKTFKSAELAVMRSGWENNNALFTALKGTDDYHQANFYHRHTNTGTFFLTALGEQWAVDLGLEDYNIEEYDVQPRLYYKLRAEGHNCNIINPASGIDNRGWEKCPIVAEGNTLKESYAVVDMTPDYDKLARSAKRGLKLFDHRRRVLVQDEISTLDGKPIDSYWFMQTEAGIEISPNGRSAMLYRGNEKLLVYMATAPVDARFTVMGTEPLIYTRPVGSKQDWTFGAKKLTIHTNTETDLKLAIVFVPLHKGDDPAIVDIPFQRLTSWATPLQNDATINDVRVDNKTVDKFDPRNFTYDVDLTSENIPIVSVASVDKNTEVRIKQATKLPGKAEISVESPGHSPSTYFVYFKVKPVRIISSASKEYSSWDESFANHRIVTPKISAGKSLEYDLGVPSSISALTIGFTNQNFKSYHFELMGSNDGKNWSQVYSGSSKVIPGLSVAMPQIFLFKPFKARFVRVQNPVNSPSFSVEILRFHNDEVSAKEYILNAYREVFSDVKIEPGSINLLSGNKMTIMLKGLTNYAKEINLSNAKITFDSENSSIATVSSAGEVLGKADGETRIRIVIHYGDIVLHKKIFAKITDPACLKIKAVVATYLSLKAPEKNLSKEKSILTGEGNQGIIAFDIKAVSKKQFKKAIIRLHAANSSFEKVITSLSLTDDNWEPTTVNFNNNLLIVKPITTFFAPPNITDYVDVDVTDFIKNNMNSRERISFILKSDSALGYSKDVKADYEPVILIY